MARDDAAAVGPSTNTGLVERRTCANTSRTQMPGAYTNARGRDRARLHTKARKVCARCRARRGETYYGWSPGLKRALTDWQGLTVQRGQIATFRCGKLPVCRRSWLAHRLNEDRVVLWIRWDNSRFQPGLGREVLFDTGDGAPHTDGMMMAWILDLRRRRLSAHARQRR